MVLKRTCKAAQPRFPHSVARRTPDTARGDILNSSNHLPLSYIRKHSENHIRALIYSRRRYSRSRRPSIDVHFDF